MRNYRRLLQSGIKQKLRLWTPADIGPRPLQGVPMWIDMSQPNVLTLDGNEITVWPDLSGNGNDAVKDPLYPAPSFTASDPMFGGLPSATNTQNVI